MPYSNPFTPTFGTAPPVLAGRADVLGRVSMAMDSGPRHPDYTLVVTGRRGTGKTVLLDVIARSAGDKGWLVLQVAGSDRPDLAANVVQRAHELVRPASWTTPSLGFSADAPSSAGWMADKPIALPNAGDLRTVLTAMAEQASANGAGVLLTVDELQASTAGALRPLASVLQHVTRREERPLMFVGCGLPDVSRTLLSDPGMTFFHRCARAETSNLTDGQARFALSEPFTAAGIPIADAALDAGVTAAVGYPFMIQHIGYAAWERVADPDAAGVSTSGMAAAIDIANLAMTQQLVEPVWVGLSAKDREFALAIAALGGAAEVRDLAAHLGWSGNTVNAYRRRAIDAGIAIAVGRGRIQFAHQAFEHHARNEQALTKLDDGTTPHGGA